MVFIAPSSPSRKGAIQLPDWEFSAAGNAQKFTGVDDVSGAGCHDPQSILPHLYQHIVHHIRSRNIRPPVLLSHILDKQGFPFCAFLAEDASSRNKLPTTLLLPLQANQRLEEQVLF